MFVVVTVVAIIVAYHVNWIRGRHSVFTSRQLSPDSDIWVRALPMAADPVSAPGLLWIFGEEGEGGLWIHFVMPGNGTNGEPMDLTPEEAIEAERIHRLFPETGFFQASSFYFR
jgi:hypothetical protein